MSQIAKMTFTNDKKIKCGEFVEKETSPYIELTTEQLIAKEFIETDNEISFNPDYSITAIEFIEE